MIVIGQRLNSTSPNVAAAVRRRVRQFVTDLACAQANAGAHFLDLNTAALGEAEEAEALCWLVETVQEACDIPLCLDSQNPDTLRAALSACRNPPILNAFSGQVNRPHELLSLFRENQDLTVIVVCYDDQGTQTTPEQRVDIATSLMRQLHANHIPEAQIVLDPVTLPSSCGPEALETTLKTIHLLKSRFPETGVLAVPSNYSYGLARRRRAEQDYAERSWIARADVFLCDPRIWAINP